MVKSSSLSFLPVLGFYQTLKNILDGLGTVPFTDVILKQILQDLNAKFTDFDNITRRAQASVHTQNLQSLDAQRDDYWRGLGGVLENYQRVANVQKRDAARLLLGFYEVYGDQVARLPQGEQTAAITNLLQDFARPDAQAALALLPFLTDWTAPLKQANSDFADLFSTRALETTVAEAGLPKKYRTDLQDLFRRFCDRINATLVMTENADAPALKAAQIINAEVQTAHSNYRPSGSADTATPPPPAN